MFNHNYGKRPLVEESGVISASVCLRSSLLSIVKMWPDAKLNLNKEEDVKKVIKIIEDMTTFNLSRENNGKVENTKPNLVKMTYTKSNLGRGYIFWFICNICKRRVQNLYIPQSSILAACRKCHRLTYKKQNDSKKFREFEFSADRFR